MRILARFLALWWPFAGLTKISSTLWARFYFGHYPTDWQILVFLWVLYTILGTVLAFYLFKITRKEGSTD